MTRSLIAQGSTPSRLRVGRVFLACMWAVVAVACGIPCRAQNTPCADAPQYRCDVRESQFVCDTPPPTFPSCHAATIAVLPCGDRVTAFFGGQHEGASDVCIWLSRRGRHDSVWTEPQAVARGLVGDSVQHPCWNPVLYRIPGRKGELLLFYKTGIYIKDWVGHLMRSGDGGRTWGSAEELGRHSDETGNFPFLGAIKNKPVATGRRIVAPSSDESVRWQIHFEVSDDGGHSWRYIHVPSADTIVSIQPTILTHRDGTLQALCRTKNGYLSTTYSHDGGLTWEPERLTAIPNNNSGIDCATLFGGRLFAMVYNPVGKDRTMEFGARTPLTLALSHDGLHWHDALTLDEGPGEFSYPSIVADGSELHIVYTWNREKIKYVSVRLTKNSNR